MKNLKIFFAVALALLVSTASLAQGRIQGRVVEILDGKTVVIEMQNLSLLNAELQYIEVPEAGQPLEHTVKDHLRELVGGKVVEFKAKGITPSRTFGQLFLNGVDISQQMIRDGAAWHAVVSSSGQNAAESNVYQSNEAQAKSEKRGIWSIENLKPSWEVRAEAAAEQERMIQALSRQKAIGQAATAQKTARRPNTATRQMPRENFQMWADVSDYGNDKAVGAGGLEMNYDSSAKVGYVATSRAIQNLTAAKNNAQTVDFRVGYFYRDWNKGRESIYAIGVLSKSGDWKFLKSNSLIVFADGQKIILGTARRYSRRNASSVEEFLLYKINRSAIAKIASANKLEVKIGLYSGNLNDKLQLMIKNLLQASA